MRLALADVKKSVVRRAGEAYLVPHLLRADEHQEQLAALIALHEEWLGRERAGFPSDRPAEIMGDYRLARGLVTALGDWYAWEPAEWPGPATATQAAALDGAGIRSAAQLRLALYDAVNDAAGGYLPGDAREDFLRAFAACYALECETLDALLALDGDEWARLGRLSAEPPTPRTLAARYNWRAVEAVLTAASSVTWTLPPEFAAARGTTLGTLLKQVCFQARQMGVYYDAEYAEALPAERAGEALGRVAEARAAYGDRRDGVSETPGVDARQGPINVLLYGPQEAFGGPTQYGDRLARLCRSILGLNRSSARGAPGRATVGLRGEALVYLRSRPFRFALDERLLALLLPGAAEETDEETLPVAVTFDSSLERLLHEEFAALERDGAAHGWHLEREPEPVLCGETILIPDFVLARGGRRVYLEVAGYWSPGYRERKARKLLALAGQIDLLVAAPQDAREAFRALEGAVPCVWYTRRPTARHLLAALQAGWDDFAHRRAAVPHEAVLAEVARRGLVPAGEVRRLVRAYDRTELTQVVADLAASAQARGTAGPLLLDGVGLASVSWLAEVRGVLRDLLAEQDAGVPLGLVAGRLTQAVPALRGIPDAEAAAETLARTCGCIVERQSLFEPVVRAPGSQHAAAPLPAVPESAQAPSRAQPRGPRRRKGSDGGAEAPILWDEEPG